MSRRLFTLCAVVMLSGCSTISGWFGGGKQKELVLPEPSGAIAPQLVWQRTIGSGDGESFSNLIARVDGDRIYVAERGGELMALASSDGSILWEVESGQTLSAGPGVGDGLVVVSSNNGTLLAYDGNDGHEVWRVSLGSENLSIPQIGQGSVVVQTADGTLHALESVDGAARWSVPRTVPTLSLRGVSSPLLLSGGVIAGFANGKLGAFSLRNGAEAWEVTVGIPGGRSELERMSDVDAEILLAGSALFAGGYQSRVMGMAVENGQVAWTRDISTSSGFAFDQQQLYLTDDEGVVWALSPRDGGSLWRQERLKGFRLTAPVVIDGTLVVGDQLGHLHWLDVRDGSLLARSKIDSRGIEAAPVPFAGRLYVYGRSGVLMAMTPNGSGGTAGE